MPATLPMMDWVMTLLDTAAEETLASLSYETIDSTPIQAVTHTIELMEIPL